MSTTSYIVALERLRQQLVTILTAKGKTVASDATMATLIPLVNSVGINDEFKKMFEGNPFEIVDSEGSITTATHALTDGTVARITRVSLPNCTQLGGSVFSGASSMTELSLPSCTQFGDYSVRECTSLTTVTLSNNISTIGKLFLRSSAITELNMGTVGTNDYAFLAECRQLIKFSTSGFTTFSFNHTSQSGGAFANCVALKIVDFGNTSAFTNGHASYSFANCTNLKAIVIRKTDAVASLGTNAAFAWLKNNSVDFKIYVPDALVDSYKVASQWSTFADYFEPLSEYDEEAILNGGAS